MTPPERANLQGDPEGVPKDKPLFTLGMWGPPLHEQAVARYLTAKDLDNFEACDVAISRLWVHGLITYSAHCSARKKLLKKIESALRANLQAGEHHE